MRTKDEIGLLEYCGATDTQIKLGKILDTFSPVLEQYRECTCMSCLKKINGAKLTYEIADMGYGSSFDGMETKIILCPKCYSKIKTNCLEHSLKKIEGEVEQEETEDKILELIESFPKQGQELFYNRLEKNSFSIPPEDWILLKTEDEEIKKMANKLLKIIK